MARRAAERRRTWTLSPLGDWESPARTDDERMAALEAIRRLAFTMRGVPYPDRFGREARRQWPLERIGCTRTSSTCSSD
jgi:hypothetical protein